MPGRTIRIGRLFGIPVGISPWWLAIVALLTWQLGSGYYPGMIPGVAVGTSYALGLVSVLLLFASVLAHELGHAVVARRRGMQVQEIDLWLLGGVSRMSGRPRAAADEVAFALAGPGVTAVVVALFGALGLILGSGHSAVRALVDYQFVVNVVLLVFNLVPAFPLDGGRVARALLWRWRGGLLAATETAASIGRACGFVLIGLGILLAVGGGLGGLWLVLIGGFIVTAAGAERLQEEVSAALAGVPVRQLMVATAPCIPEQITLGDAEHFFARHRSGGFPVIDADGRAVGVVGIDQLQRAPRWQRYQVLVGDRTDRDPDLRVGPDSDVALLLQSPAFARAGRAVVIDADGRPLGVVTAGDIQREIRAVRLSGGAGRRAA